MSDSFVLQGSRVAIAGALRPAAIHVENGRIAEIGERVAGRSETRLDVGDAVVFPGLIDSHVHIDQPGRTQWEGFATATAAAAAGGVTTLVDMPLNSIPATTTVEALRAKCRAARGRCRVDVGFWGGLVPENANREGEVLEALDTAGVLGFKAFLVPSGVPEFGPVGSRELEAAFPVLARLGATLLVHSESPAVLDRAAQALRGSLENLSERRRYAVYLATRPPEAESEAVRWLVDLARQVGPPGRLHIVHVAAVEALEVLRKARRDGLPVSAETCPHYLTFAAEDIPEGATEYKCAPPVRESRVREALWQALEDGVLDLVASDHSPSPPELKHRESGDFLNAWGGIASLQLLLPAVWTGARRRGIALERLADWLAAAPAELARLESAKGSIEVGKDADLVVWDPEASFEVRPEELHHRHPLTPYAGRRLYGVVHRTFLRGVEIYRDGEPVGLPCGRLLRRPSEGDRLPSPLAPDGCNDG